MGVLCRVPFYILNIDWWLGQTLRWKPLLRFPWKSPRAEHCQVSFPSLTGACSKSSCEVIRTSQCCWKETISKVKHCSFCAQQHCQSPASGGRLLWYRRWSALSLPGRSSLDIGVQEVCSKARAVWLHPGVVHLLHNPHPLTLLCRSISSWLHPLLPLATADPLSCVCPFRSDSPCRMGEGANL